MGAGAEVIVVLDSNVLFSAIIRPRGCPYAIYNVWLDRRFTLATCREQMGEIKAAYRGPKLTELIPRHRLGRLLNEMRRSALQFPVQRRHTAVDPTDAFLLDLASASGAHYLVTGDKRAGLLERERVEGTRILTPTDFCSRILRVKV
jgi:putative PIN family toxin of toxin-antitoxin system